MYGEQWASSGRFLSFKADGEWISRNVALQCCSYANFLVGGIILSGREKWLSELRGRTVLNFNRFGFKGRVAGIKLGSWSTEPLVFMVGLERLNVEELELEEDLALDEEVNMLLLLIVMSNLAAAPMPLIPILRHSETLIMSSLVSRLDSTFPFCFNVNFRMKPDPSYAVSIAKQNVWLHGGTLIVWWTFSNFDPFFH
ncbi:hypothetical protein CPB84DRAFT_1827863 [Gymnopilus junonius]|uniref:Uncharacterized protein n=1 Tax=Gymnopilus junonius TaxID=109634 RepID=A0A9P5NFH2_GYMJU|nr:hypothetical protein CPB84DRAFT_1827863 [Gymnopilus junonius]